MRYREIVHQLLQWSSDELLAAVAPLASRARSKGLQSLSSAERYLLCRAIDVLPNSSVESLPYPNEVVRRTILRLRIGATSYARTASLLLGEVADSGHLHLLDRQPLDGGPAVIFAANVGAQVPVAGDTLGNDMRNIRSLQPPLGQYHVASFLSLLGIETEVFNLALGPEEFDELADTLARVGRRLFFLSFASSFLGPAELDTAYAVAELLRPSYADGLRPRFIGGGMGVYFARDTYLRHTPLEIVIGRYGEPTLADMTLGCSYTGPEDDRPNTTLFEKLPNLFIAVDGSQGRTVIETPVQMLSRPERRVLALGVDLSKMRLAEKYWPKAGAIGICSPDDLNIPTSGADRDGRDGPGEGIVRPAPRHHEFHLANYTFKPKNAKLMTTFGNCPRGCKFCQFTSFDEGIFFMVPDDIVAHFNRALAIHPEIHMFVLDDDDFLLRDAHVRRMIDCLRDNEPTKQKVFYVETVPMEIDEEIVRDLRAVGFRAILLGIESPVERVARQVGKLMPSHAYDKFINAPFVTQDAGLFTRVTAIPFYPLVTEAELLPVIDGLLTYLEYGISVSVFPLVKALPGTEFVMRAEHEMSHQRYLSPATKQWLSLPDLVLPDDTVVREVALATVKRTGATLEQILRTNKITGDFSMTIGVLSFFLAAVEVWHAHPGRTVPDDDLDRLTERINGAVGQATRKHFALADLKDALEMYRISGDSAFEKVRPWIQQDTVPFVHWGLRMAIDFGDDPDVRAAERVMGMLQRIGASSPLTEDSLAYRVRPASG